MPDDKKISELAAATLPLVGTELMEVVQGGVNKQAPLSAAGVVADLLIDLVSVAVSAGTLTLDTNNQKQRRFHLTATQSSNFTIAFSNDSVGLIKTLDAQITGTITITMPSSVVMLEEDSRWNNGTKIFTAAGGTASPFEFSWTKSGSLWKLKATSKYYAS